MARRLLLFLSLLTVGVGAAQAQPADRVSLTNACRPAATETPASLQAREAAINQEIARLGQRETPALRKKQEDLLEIQFLIDCLAQSTLKHGVGKSGPGATPKELVEITTYYATNRNKTGGVYGPDVGSLHYGRAVVTIQRGEIGTYRVWRLKTQPNPSKHFGLKSVTPLEFDAARNEMVEKVKLSTSKAILMFVHGYDTGFADAATRTAQLALDLDFPGMPFFFSWPSANRVRAYLPDEESAHLSQEAFQRLIDELSQLPASDIYIVAHGIGARIVSGGLQRRAELGKPNTHLRELFLAAPDINAELFRTSIAPQLSFMQGMRTTIYASSSDLALRASKVMHGYPRVGETIDRVLTYPGLDTVDASALPGRSWYYGHSYVVDAPSVLSDIKSIIMQRSLVPHRD